MNLDKAGFLKTQCIVKTNTHYTALKHTIFRFIQQTLTHRACTLHVKLLNNVLTHLVCLLFRLNLINRRVKSGRNTSSSYTYEETVTYSYTYVCKHAIYSSLVV